MLGSRRGFTIGRHPRRGRAGRVNDIVAVTELIDAVRSLGSTSGPTQPARSTASPRATIWNERYGRLFGWFSLR